MTTTIISGAIFDFNITNSLLFKIPERLKSLTVFQGQHFLDLSILQYAF